MPNVFGELVHYFITRQMLFLLMGPSLALFLHIGSTLHISL